MLKKKFKGHLVIYITFRGEQYSKQYCSITILYCQQYMKQFPNRADIKAKQYLKSNNFVAVSFD